MKAAQSLVTTSIVLAAALAAVSAQAPRASVPTIPFESSTDFLKYSPDMNFGEVLGVAVNSKGHVVVLNHQGSTSAPLYGNASTQILEFDQAGKFVREIGRNVYGLGYSHSVRFARYDNLWVVDKGTNAVVRSAISNLCGTRSTTRTCSPFSRDNAMMSIAPGCSRIARSISTR